MSLCIESVTARLTQIVLVLACATRTACDRNELPPDARVPARKLPAFIDAAAIVDASSTLEMWRGIARHPGQRELQTAVPRQSGLFEATPLIPSASDVEWMRAYLARGERMTLPEEGVFKMCGGFHADFALVFAGGVDALEYHLCFGCMEVKIFVDGLQILLLDVSDYELLGRFQPYLKP